MGRSIFGFDNSLRDIRSNPSSLPGNQHQRRELQAKERKELMKEKQKRINTLFNE